MKKNSYNKVEIINSIIIAFYLSVPMVSKVVTSIIPIDNNIIILTGLLIILFFINNKKNLILQKKVLIINIIISLMFLISLLRDTSEAILLNYLLSYILYGAIGLFFIQYKIDYETVFKYISKIFVFFTLVLILKYIPLISTKKYLGFTMDISYSALIGFTATIFYLKYNKSKILNIIYIACILVNIYYLSVLNDNRGSILTLFILLIICFLKRIKNKKGKITVFIIGVFICIISVNTIFNYIEDIDTNINWLNRLVSQINENNLTSNRNNLYNYAIEMIDSNYLFGVGIGKFEEEYQGQYTHNLFLQLACEGGMIFAMIVGGYIIFCAYKTIFNDSNDANNEFMIFLLIQFFPRLIISSVYWVNSFIWIYIFKSMEGDIKDEKDNVNKTISGS